MLDSGLLTLVSPSAVSICDSVLASLREKYPLEHPACAAVDLVRARIRGGEADDAA